MNKIVLLTLAITALMASVNGHAWMRDPIARGSLWRKYPDEFPEDVNDTQWCEVIDRRTGEILPNSRNVSCGIAGPVYSGRIDGPTTFFLGSKARGQYRQSIGYSYEFGSSLATRKIVRTYEMGSIINIELQQGARHRGFIQFRLCDAPEDRDPDWECFDNHPLKFENGETRIPLESVPFVLVPNVHFLTGSTRPHRLYTYRVQLPENKTCDHCVLQMLWNQTRNGQNYNSAADIAIVENLDQ